MNDDDKQCLGWAISGVVFALCVSWFLGPVGFLLALSAVSLLLFSL